MISRRAALFGETALAGRECGILFKIETDLDRGALRETLSRTSKEKTQNARCRAFRVAKEGTNRVPITRAFSVAWR